MSELSLLFVCDGERETYSVPALVRKHVPAMRCGRFLIWSNRRLNRSSGYDKKLRFILLEARDDGFDGIIAALDRDNDKPRERLRKLVAERERDRQNMDRTHLPVAVGEAAPHAEAWLLDDEKAVRTTLGIASSKPIPNVSKCPSPKQVLNVLFSEVEVNPIEALGRIAEELDESRCNHADSTGLKAFLDDVRSEFPASG